MRYKVICKRACTTPGYNRRIEYSRSRKNHTPTVERFPPQLNSLSIFSHLERVNGFYSHFAAEFSRSEVSVF